MILLTLILLAQSDLPPPLRAKRVCQVANLLTQSKAFDHADWNAEGGGVSAPTKTANAGTAPDGTTTADRVQFANTTGSQYSDIYQLGVGIGVRSCSVWVKGFSGNGTIDLTLRAAGPTWTSVPCAFVSASWTECKHENRTTVAGDFYIGNSSYATGSGNRTGTDVLLWGAQCVVGATAPTCVAQHMQEAYEMLASRPQICPWMVR